MRIRDWSSDVCSSDLNATRRKMIKYGMIGMLMMTVPAVQVSAQADAPSFAIFEHRPSATAAEPAEPSFAAQSEMDWGASKAAPSFREEIYVANVREAELRSEERRVGKECGRTGRDRGW